MKSLRNFSIFKHFFENQSKSCFFFTHDGCVFANPKRKTSIDIEMIDLIVWCFWICWWRCVCKNWIQKRKKQCFKFKSDEFFKWRTIWISKRKSIYLKQKVFLNDSRSYFVATKNLNAVRCTFFCWYFLKNKNKNFFFYWFVERNVESLYDDDDEYF